MVTQENNLIEVLTKLNAGNPRKLIKACLTLRQMTQRMICRKIGVPHSILSMVISGKRKTPWIRKALADELGVPVEVLFHSTQRAHKPANENHALNPQHQECIETTHPDPKKENAP